MGWNPEAQLPFATGGQPLGEALRALLEPMELAYRIVDRDTLQITSRQAIDAHVEPEFYPVSDLLGTDALPNNCSMPSSRNWAKVC